MSRIYLLFGGAIYYPSGGVEDLLGQFESIDDAKKYAEAGDQYGVWAQIVEKQTLKLVLIGDHECLCCDDDPWEWYKPGSKD